ncbi:MAG: aspartate/tyrosine/aromatic aminotransferase [Hyphomonadaceae bacterium]|nr:aspartate/tyrosine/aromatic aminotransferase [Hyphomonadaceae bacterium]
MTDFLSGLAISPPDPLLGIMSAFRADPRENKFDLGVGVYRDETGSTPVLEAVKTAERHITQRQATKAYEGPRGNAGFCEAIETLVFGAQSEARSEERVVSVTSPGGCGAIFLAMTLAARTSPKGRIWVSDPSWPNHLKVAAAAGRTALGYPYMAPDGTLDFPRMMDALRQATPGDIVIFQGPCHNPSGIDPSEEQWAYLGDFCERQGLFPLLDVAYHGFAHGLEEDMAGIRAFLAACRETMVAYSCSKNFGLYRERTGCFLVQTEAPRDAQAVASHLADIARAVYSMPPAHGAAIVETILASEELTALWHKELTSMRSRIRDLRRNLADALKSATGMDGFEALANQTGMFSLLPLQGPITDMLRVQSAVYLPASGRINIAGLTQEGIAPLVGQLTPYLQASLAQQ